MLLLTKPSTMRVKKNISTGLPCHEDNEITVGNYAIETLDFLRSFGYENDAISLVKSSPSAVGTLSEYREKLKQNENTKHDLDNVINSSSRFLATSTLLFKASKRIACVLKDKNFHLWKYTTHDQCGKNHQLSIPSSPFLICQAPSGHSTLRPVLASVVKTNPTELRIYDLHPHFRANESTQNSILE